MSEKLTITNRITGDEAHVSLIGIIDEDANFDKVKSLKMSSMIFDFTNITMINSCGIREWIKYLQDIEETKIIYTNCPQIIIEQINMVHGFIKKGSQVESFFAPYFCTKCDTGKKILLKSSEISGTKPPIKLCNTCNSELDFDAIEKQYFSFLTQGK